jgi:hypothetical protein
MSFRRADRAVQKGRGENFYAMHNLEEYLKSFLLAPRSIPAPARRNDMTFYFTLDWHI